MNCRYYTEATLGWMLNNKIIVLLSLLSFCLFVSTLAMAGQRNRYAAEVEELKTLTSTAAPTTESETSTDTTLETTTTSDSESEAGDNSETDGGENAETEDGENTVPEDGDNTVPEGDENSDTENGEGTNENETAPNVESVPSQANINNVMNSDANDAQINSGDTVEPSSANVISLPDSKLLKMLGYAV